MIGKGIYFLHVRMVFGATSWVYDFLSVLSVLFDDNYG